MKIKFSNLVDFIAELEKDKEKIERGIVRVNTVFQPSNMSPTIRLAFVMAECIIGNHVVAYREYCGDLWGEGFECDEKTKRLITLRRDRLNEVFGRLGITDVRGGTIEEAE